MYTSDLDPSQGIRVTNTPANTLSALGKVYADLGIPLGTLAPDSGLIGNINLRVPSHSISGKPLSAYLNCGRGLVTGDLADQGEVTISVLSKVVANGDSASFVTTEVSGRARSVGVSSDQVACQSNGGLERRINVGLQLAIASAQFSR
jgi:hypothetical protein